MSTERLSHPDVRHAAAVPQATEGTSTPTTSINMDLSRKGSVSGDSAEFEGLLRQEFGSKSELEGYICTRCGTRDSSESWTTLRELPETAIVQLRRHKHSTTSGGDKIMDRVNFDVDKLLSFPGNPGKLCLLVAVLRHEGTSLNRGHNTSVIRTQAVPGSTWTKLDDRRVSVINASEVCDDRAYVLVYRQRDSRDVSLFMDAGQQVQVRQTSAAPTASTTAAPLEPTWTPLQRGKQATSAKARRAQARGSGRRVAPSEQPDWVTYGVPWLDNPKGSPQV